MPSLRDVKRRITSVHNTSKVTHALEAVSATKMRRWQERALNARPFALKALALLASLRERSPQKYIAKTQRVLDPEAPQVLLVISSDKGLCGGYNLRLLNKVNDLAKTMPHLKCVALGKYGKEYLHRRGQEIILDETGFGERVSRERIKELYEFLEQGFLQGIFSRVLVNTLT